MVQSTTTTLVPSKTTPTMTTTTTTAGNGVKTPDPVQPGIVSNCGKFYLVQKGEGCADIASKHGITLAQFTTWNSKTGTNCAGLWADTYACVSIIGHDATPTKPSTPTNGIETTTRSLWQTFISGTRLLVLTARACGRNIMYALGFSFLF